MKNEYNFLWTLRCGSTEKSFADWGLCDLHRTCLNQAPDRVTFRQPGTAFDSDPLWQPGSRLEIFRDGKPWFLGTLLRTPGFGQAGSEEKHYELAGPWHFLENLVFQQEWHQATAPKPATRASSRLILGQNATGTPIPHSEQMAEILNYAIARGAPFQIGTIGLDLATPFLEARDLSCAEALQRLLRWAPDSVVHFDYTTPGLPTLHIRRRCQMPTKTLTLGDPSSPAIRRLAIAPRHDLLRPAVVLHYERHRPSAHGPGIALDAHTDRFPAEATGSEPGALVMTLELEAAPPTLLRQAIRTAPIRPFEPAWWQEQTPALNIPGLKNLRVREVSRKSPLDNALTAGVIYPWMPIRAEEDTLCALLSWETPTESVVDRPVTIRLVATDGTTGEYHHLQPTAPAETPPPNLARHLHRALATLHYEGEITLHEPEVETGPWLGHTLSLANSRPEWARMNALIQEVREFVDSGQTTLRFGPPSHLGPADLVELLRMNRQRTPAHRAHARSTGSLANTLPVATGQAPLYAAFTGTGQYRRMVFTCPEHPGRQIILDASGIQRHAVLTIREEDVCHNGELRKRLVLASEPFQP